MVKLKTQYPFVDENGNINSGLIKTYAIDEETKEQYFVKQNETGQEYGEAVDIVQSYIENGEAKYRPKYYTYSVTNNIIPKEEKEEE